MLGWLAMIVGGNLGMKNRIEQYREMKKPRFNETVDKKLSKELDRADDDGFALPVNDMETAEAEKELDCWGDLWQCIKVKSAQFFGQKNKK